MLFIIQDIQTDPSLKVDVEKSGWLSQHDMEGQTQMEKPIFMTYLLY